MSIDSIFSFSPQTCISNNYVLNYNKQKGNVTGIGYFVASTGAAAALIDAEKMKNLVKTVVSRGGRVDLAS